MGGWHSSIYNLIRSYYFDFVKRFLCFYRHLRFRTYSSKDKFVQEIVSLHEVLEGKVLSYRVCFGSNIDCLRYIVRRLFLSGGNISFPPGICDIVEDYRFPCPRCVLFAMLIVFPSSVCIVILPLLFSALFLFWLH